MSDDVDDDVFAEVSWNSEDVQTLRPDWSEEKCNELLAQAEGNIQSIMATSYMRWSNQSSP